MKAFVARKIDDVACDPVPCVEAYLKSEADKVIAELQSKLEAKELELVNLKCDALNTDKARKEWLQLARKQAMNIRHQKYKRCKKMADYCNAKIEEYRAEYDADEGFRDEWLYWIKFMRKWMYRWLQLADNFKGRSNET